MAARRGGAGERRGDGLVDAGVRFVTMDLRGMGETSTEWKPLDDAAVAEVCTVFEAVFEHRP